MSEEIRNKVELLYSELNASLDPSKFVFNPRVGEILLEIENLQKQCQHHFGKGNKCEFCGFHREG